MRDSSLRSQVTRAGGSLLAVALLLTACGGDDAFSEGDGNGGDGDNGGGGGELTISGQDFAESVIMQSLYAGVLEEAGYTVEITTVSNRGIYMDALQSGQVDIVPDYAASAAEELNRQQNGAEAEPVATSDVDETISALTELGQQVGIEPLEPAEASNQNAMVVRQDFAEEHQLSTISDLAAMDQNLDFATAADCEENYFCLQGLKETYGLTFNEPVQPTGFGSTDTKLAVEEGDADVGWTGTTDGTLDTFGLVVLEDDQGLQTAENLVPLVNTEGVDDDAAREALNQVSAELTTDDLVELNSRVDQDRELPEDVAAQWLADKGLVEE